jgi:lysozyme family protein
MSFDNAFERTIGLEGGYSNDPADPGGETMYGITKKQYPNEDIKNMTLERAKLIYKQDYWDRLRLGELDNASIAEKLFDICVNMGPGRATLIAQKAVNFIGYYVEKTTDEDGRIGPETMKFLNYWCQREDDTKALFKAINGFQFMYYVEICKANPALYKFSKGWMRRIGFEA